MDKTGGAGQDHSGDKLFLHSDTVSFIGLQMQQLENSVVPQAQDFA